VSIDVGSGEVGSAEHLRETPTARRTIYSGRLLTVHEDDVCLVDGTRAQREVVEHPGAVAIVAIDSDGRVVLVRQWRHAVGRALWELPPGEAAYPYHFHLGEEELIVVLSGRPSLRGPMGWREVPAGEVLAFPRGEVGAHQFVNRTGETVRFLAVSTNGDPDVVLYPDSDKVGAVERLPLGGGFARFFRVGDSVDYYDGEQGP